MYFSYTLSKHFVHILVLVAIQLHIRNVSSWNMTNAYLSHKCYVKQGTYNSGSKYEANLKELETSFPSGDFRMGHSGMSIHWGKGLDVYVLFQCRGDTYGSKCHSCFTTAFNALRRRCPNNKGGIIWYDQCLVEFSSIDTANKIDYDNRFCMSNKKNITGNQFDFLKQWVTLINKLMLKAIDEKTRVDGALKPYAAGTIKFGDETIYGMVQCTEDLENRKDCDTCLMNSFTRFESCWKNKRGGRVVGRSCGFRFEFYPFLKESLTYI